MKLASIIALSLTIAACGGGSGSGSRPAPTGNTTPDKTPTGTVTANNETLRIVGNYQTATANSTTPNKISISGDGNTIYIQTNTDSLDIIGNSNFIDISNGVTIQSCTLVGNANKAQKPSGLKIACSVAGNDNTGF